MKRLLIIGLAILLSSCSATSTTSDPVRTVERVDLQRYLGTWYEIASFPMYFQKQCIADTQAVYALRPDRDISVHNSCTTEKGTDQADGIAKVVEHSNNAQLRVAFFRPFWGDYWIIGLDPDYRWAVVGTPNRDYLWLLSRTRRMDKPQLELARDAARRQGFDLTRLHYTQQNDAAAVGAGG